MSGERGSTITRLWKLIPIEVFSEDIVSIVVAINLSRIIPQGTPNNLIVEGASVAIFLVFVAKKMYNAYTRDEELNREEFLCLFVLEAVYMCGVHCLLSYRAASKFSPVEKLLMNSVMTYLNMATLRQMFCKRKELGVYKSAALFLGIVTTGICMMGLLAFGNRDNLVNIIGFSGLAAVLVSSIKERPSEHQKMTPELRFLYQATCVAIGMLNIFLFSEPISQLASALTPILSDYVSFQ